MEKNFKELRRFHGIDALRGLAAVLMLEQHLVYWLCDDLKSKTAIVAGAMGGLAAPLFIMLAGFGAHFTGECFRNSHYVLFSRGFMIFVFGYILNFSAPNWFSMGAWYVLHLIGVSMMISPLFKHLSSGALLALIFIILLAAFFLQNGFNTPLQLYNEQMSAPAGFGNILKHAVAEGYFPMFPWCAYFVTGFLAGRWVITQNHRNVIYLALTVFLLFLILTFVYSMGAGFATSGSWMRMFRFIPTFYPSLTPISLCLISITLFCISGFIAIDAGINIKSNNAFVCLGRVPLTFLIIHVAVIRESAVRFNFWRSFSLFETLFITAGIIALFAVSAVIWQKISFRFGAEWLLRKLSVTGNGYNGIFYFFINSKYLLILL